MKTLREYINIMESLEQGVTEGYIDREDLDTRITRLLNELGVEDTRQGVVDALVDFVIKEIEDQTTSEGFNETQEDPVARVEQLAQELRNR